MLLKSVLSEVYTELSTDRQSEILNRVQTSSNSESDNVEGSLLQESYLKTFAIMTIEERLQIYKKMVAKGWLSTSSSYRSRGS